MREGGGEKHEIYLRRPSFYDLFSKGPGAGAIKYRLIAEEYFLFSKGEHLIVVHKTRGAARADCM